jgi:hypothetical protein
VTTESQAPETHFEKRWRAGQQRGWSTGSWGTDPILAAVWYHMGCADMAYEFAQGEGATMRLLAEIRDAIDRLAKRVQAQPGEDS